MTVAILFGCTMCILVCAVLSISMHFLPSVLHSLISFCMESMFKLMMFSAAVSGIPSKAWQFPQTTKNTHFFLTFLNLIVAMDMPNCSICIPLYVFSFMLFFMDLLSCSTDLLPYNFLNIYSGIELPSLPVSILYGIFIGLCKVRRPYWWAHLNVWEFIFVRFTQVKLTIDPPSIKLPWQLYRSD